jgi:hypothetical protein
MADIILAPLTTDASWTSALAAAFDRAGHRLAVLRRARRIARASRQVRLGRALADADDGVYADLGVTRRRGELSDYAMALVSAGLRVSGG